MERRIRGFSIVELLAVMAVVGILLALTVPAMTSLMESSNLTRAGQMMADQVNLARQIASARNTTVEIRLVRMEDASSGYEAIQLWTNDAAGNAKPLGSLSLFPQSTSIAGNTAVLSRMLSIGSDSTMPANSGAGSNKKYRSFQIRPNGLVTPTLPMERCYLAVVGSRYAGDSQLPKNYVTVQINPQTGTPLVYRP